MNRSTRWSKRWLTPMTALLAACAGGGGGSEFPGGEQVSANAAASADLPHLEGTCVPSAEMTSSQRVYPGASRRVGRKSKDRTEDACEATTFGGRARVVEATALKLVDVSVVDTGPLPATGGTLEEELVSVTVPGVLTAGVASAETQSDSNSVQSDASVAGLNLTVGGLVVGATVVASQDSATCSGSGPTTSGSSTVTGLTIGGIAVTVTGAPNQVVISGLVRVVINEQIVTSGDIVVRALHVNVLGPLNVADVIISESDAQVICSCSGSPDGGETPDANPPEDAGPGLDAGVPEDAAPSQDASSPEDAGNPEDASNPEGRGSSPDANPSEDASPGEDSSAPADGGSPDAEGPGDGGGSPDASHCTDGGIVDGGGSDGAVGDASSKLPRLPRGRSYDAAAPVSCDNDNPCSPSYTCVLPKTAPLP